LPERRHFISSAHQIGKDIKPTINSVFRHIHTLSSYRQSMLSMPWSLVLIRSHTQLWGSLTW
jgi:hypothetical protein